MKQRISSLIRMGRDYWRPLHRRMDYWASMYLLFDEIQQSKPAGYRRFISNEPRTAVDSAVAIMTRNNAFWRIDKWKRDQIIKTLLESEKIETGKPPEQFNKDVGLPVNTAAFKPI